MRRSKLNANQLEAFSPSEMAGRGPSFFGSVDLLVRREALALSSAAERLRELGWELKEHRHGYYVATKGRAEVTAITPRGIVKAAERSARRSRQRAFTFGGSDGRAAAGAG